MSTDAITLQSPWAHGKSNPIRGKTRLHVTSKIKTMCKQCELMDTFSFGKCPKMNNSFRHLKP